MYDAPGVAAAEWRRGAGRLSRRASLAGALVAAAVLAAPGRARADGAAGVCTLGVFPYLPPLTIERLFAPIALEFGRILGTDIQLKSRPSFEAFAAELDRGSYDLALLHPFFYVEASARQGYVPLARVDQELRAVLLGRGPAITALSELRGKTLALPPRLAAVSYMVAAALFDAGLRPNVDVILDHHADKLGCLHAVATGVATACGVPSFLLTQLDAIAQMQLHPVWSTEPLPSLVFVAHPRLGQAARERLGRAMLAWSGNEPGRTLLAGLGWPGLVAVSDAEFTAVRALGSRLSAYAAW